MKVCIGTTGPRNHRITAPDPFHVNCPQNFDHSALRHQPRPFFSFLSSIKLKQVELTPTRSVSGPLPVLEKAPGCRRPFPFPIGPSLIVILFISSISRRSHFRLPCGHCKTKSHPRPIFYFKLIEARALVQPTNGGGKSGRQWERRSLFLTEMNHRFRAELREDKIIDVDDHVTEPVEIRGFDEI
jgi:hypothetical protein